MNTKLQELKDTAASNKRGVENFNDFRLEMTKKVAFVHGAAWAWTIILTTLLSLGVWGFSEVYPAIRQIMIEYYSRHPNAVYHRHKSDSDKEPVLANRRSHEASLPASYEMR